MTEDTPAVEHRTIRDDSRDPWQTRWLCTCRWASRWGDSGSPGPGLDLIRHALDTDARPVGE